MSHRSQNEINAEIYGELSTNLFKLEKVGPNFPKVPSVESVLATVEMFVAICWSIYARIFLDLLT